MSNTTRTLIASALTLGLALSSSAAFAKDPAAKSPPTSTHPTTHADRHDSNEPVTDTWITTKVKADLLASSNVPVHRDQGGNRERRGQPERCRRYAGGEGQGGQHRQGHQGCDPRRCRRA